VRAHGTFACYPSSKFSLSLFPHTPPRFCFPSIGHVSTGLLRTPPFSWVTEHDVGVIPHHPGYRNYVKHHEPRFPDTDACRTGVCYGQPQLVPQPRAEPTQLRPSTSRSASHHVSQCVSHSRDYATRATLRASDFNLTRERQSKFRPSISHPTEFRHFDGSKGIQCMLDEASMPDLPCRSFQPLELSIHSPNGCGRLSPLPDFRGEECWSNSPKELGIPAEARVRVRDSRTHSLSSSISTSSSLSYRRIAMSPSHRSSIQSQKSTSTHERHLSGTTATTMATPTLSLLPEDPKSSSGFIHEKPKIQRSRTSGTLSPSHLISRLPSPSRNRANTAPSRPSSLRRTQTEVDDAIRELNTIVEERRANAYHSRAQTPALINRPPPSPSHHVPYIAPSMRMRVRSETLSDIGSAFSAPLPRKALGPRPSTGINTTVRSSNLKLAPSTHSYTGPSTPNPATPPAPATPTTSISRLGAWLRRSASTIALAARSTAPKPATLHKCETRSSLTSTCRPSTSESRTIVHSRQASQDSNETATTTLVSSSSSTRSTHSTPPPRKLRRIPAPLTLLKEKELAIEATLPSARSTSSSQMSASPHHDLLHDMDMNVKDIEVMERGKTIFPGPVPAVGVAL